MAAEIFPYSLCNCSEKSSVHVHCQCNKCNGKAVDRKTQVRHIEIQRLVENVAFEAVDVPTITISSTDNSPTSSQQHESEQSEEFTDCFLPLDQERVERVDSGIIETSLEQTQESLSVSLEPSENEQPMEILTKNAIVSAIFESLNLATKMDISLNNFDDLLAMAKSFYCKGAQIDINDSAVDGWPKNWTAARKHLGDMGYVDAKEYYICLSDVHPCHWDILESKNDTCRYCDQNGTILYYYLGLQAKVKLWVSDKTMCQKITEHWREKEHWLGRNEGWHLKKEIWDGDRFAELSWFFNPDSRWCLPVMCKMDQCKNVISGEQVESLAEVGQGLKEVTCNECGYTFQFTPKYTCGDPRNIALMGHWDGFQPFGMKSRSCGAMEVTIATMSKANRCKDEETYTVGFVPSYFLPDSRPNSLDPFLHPLICDLETGFIEGFEVDYAGDLDCFPAGRITIRLLLLLWTGDHPAQCEVCKSKGAGGKNPCRRCKLKAVYLEEQKHYYYPGFREAFRFPPQKREISEELPAMIQIEQEERITVAARMSRESGFLGVSQLHRLHKLYKFDVLKDLVFDVMHLVPLNLVKRRLDSFVLKEKIDINILDAALKNIPWTREYKESGLPLSMNSYKFWKASEFQKFAFPASEYVFQGLLSPDDAEVWAPIPRIVESIFNCGLDGWSNEMIKNFHHLCWRYCILVEEAYGVQECLITLHTLTHVPDDIKRFSSPDNYWCFQYERAVGRYVKQPSNKKGIEKTFARKESQREFIKFNSSQQTQESISGKYDAVKMTATSLQAAQSLAKRCEFTSDATRANSGILIGTAEVHLFTPDQEQGISRCLIHGDFGIDAVLQFGSSYRSALRPLQKALTGGTLYQTGDTVLASQDNGRGHVILKILKFYLLSVDTHHIPVAIGDLYKACRDEENRVLRHPFSDGIIIEPHETNFSVHVRDIKRKLMLYPYDEAYTFIDTHRPLKLPPVVVPVFPQTGDMALVKGDEDEIWKADIRSVDYNLQMVKGYFFIKHPNWNTNGLWQRESRRRNMDAIHFKSLVGLANGKWQGPYWKDNEV